MAEIMIREAVPADAEGIARVHGRTWQTAYAGLFPAEGLKKLDENFDRRVDFWQKNIEEAENSGYLFVAEEGGQVIGFAVGGKERTAEWPFEGELFAIYILEAHQQKGIGRRLVRAVAQALVGRGSNSMLVWVLRDSPFRAFYEALGGEKVGEQDHEVWGKQYKVVGYGWERLEELIGSESTRRE
jgi:GNAT superfamily N-acetyltransferase